MKFQKLVLFIVLLSVSVLGFGCATRPRDLASNYRDSARIDFVNSVPGSMIRVRDNYDNQWSAFVPYGQTVWVPLHLSYYESIANATVEVVVNGKSDMLSYGRSFSHGQGGIFYANVLVKGQQNSNAYLSASY